MNADTIAPVTAPTAARFDAKFIEDHKLLDRYLEGKLPPKGARDLENWCRANPADSGEPTAVGSLRRTARPHGAEAPVVEVSLRAHRRRDRCSAVPAGVLG